MRPFMEIIVIAGLLATLGCQAKKDLEQCRLTQQGLESSLGECEQAKSQQEINTAEVIELMILSSRDELENCNTEWAVKLEKSQQEFTQSANALKEKIQDIQQELQKANENNQALQAELQEAKNALVAAIEKSKADNVEIEKLNEALENRNNKANTE